MPPRGDGSGEVAGVIETNDDAQASKLACVRLGYFRDDFVQFFVKTPVRRAPIINRGYYSRFAALRALLLDFLKQTASQDGVSPRKRQVIVLGAGYDTTFFQLVTEGALPVGGEVSYVELDFHDVTHKKSMALEHCPPLNAALRRGNCGIEEGISINAVAGEVLSPAYSLLSADLRNIDQVEAALSHAGVDFDAPTFVLAECVLVYMEPRESMALLSWFGQRLSTAALAIYEQVNPNDAFGRQMMMNLTARGCPLLGIVDSVEGHAARLKEAGWQRAEVRTMAEVHRSCLDPADRRRIERLEIFDEFEEWNLIQGHYCISLGINDAAGTLAKYTFPAPAPDPRTAALAAILAAKRI